MDLIKKIRVVPDYPQEGISYKDVSTLIRDPESFRFAIQDLSRRCQHAAPDIIACAKARGLMIGAPLAYLMGVGLVVMRRPGNLPGEVFSLQQELEFGDTREVIKDSIAPGQRVLIVDELLATGGTSVTAAKIIEKLGGIVVGTAFLIEITGLGGRARLKDYDTISLIQYNY
ncbi:Adenine phosphoribosyltransferase [Desulfofarcimen acetoxidans DSM 771]|jgi:adenine phosphoribosyltransferase|uniref:Adenine phosphoribosyltransferase n=1 Tax=Desulfofarcimen acetoxidans (strain ATCC 49208 / DSM 771 / KCTC 5769 / VKM B-1644 / 5575) TaxID=485916 RepID=C8VZX4_DESAS|nr:adenine phosphoribosyltransferase [Desulfofarcimen acetoxidans]ACV63102.1 Adenine phosphoribosyltransferase [Desulfofarcimen acetoxidans DSM 771]